MFAFSHSTQLQSRASSLMWRKGSRGGPRALPWPLWPLWPSENLGAERLRGAMASNLAASLLLVAMPLVTSSFLLLVVRHLLLVAMHLLLVAFFKRLGTGGMFCNFFGA